MGLLGSSCSGLVMFCREDDASDSDQGQDEEEIVVGIGDWRQRIAARRPAQDLSSDEALGALPSANGLTSAAIRL
jgi:hypothetical protein